MICTRIYSILSLRRICKMLRKLIRNNVICNENCQSKHQKTQFKKYQLVSRPVCLTVRCPVPLICFTEVSRRRAGNRLLLNIPWRKQRRSRLKVDAGRCWSHANPLLGLLTKQFSRKTTAAACFDIHNFTHFYINYEHLFGL